MNVPDEVVYHKHVMYTKRYINVMNVPDEGVYHKHVMYTKRYINVMNVPDEVYMTCL
jgi:hypothetical protein